MFVWPEEFFGYKIPEKPLNLYFKTEVLEQAKTLAPMFNREWVHKQLGYLGDETTHRSTSSIRTPDAHGWGLLFRTFYGLEGAITEDEIREEIVELLGAGETKYRHQATYEVLFGLVMSLKFAPDDHVQRTWQWLLPFLLNIYETMLNPDNVAYWRSFLSTTMVLLS
jgi:proteasome activator subunit 4